MAFLVILMYFVAAGSLVFSDWWLSEWINTLTAVNYFFIMSEWLLYVIV